MNKIIFGELKIVYDCYLFACYDFNHHLFHLVHLSYSKVLLQNGTSETDKWNYNNHILFLYFDLERLKK